MKKLRSVWKVLVCALFTAVFVPFSSIRDAQAEEVDAAAVPQQINLYDAFLEFPQPAWITGQIEQGDILDRSEFFKEQKGPQFILEQIPAGESFARWTQLFAVVAEELDAGASIPIGTFVDFSIATNQEACAANRFAFQSLSVSENDAILLMVCGSTDHGPAEFGYGPGVGEISLWRFIVFESTYLKLYQRWRGTAFDIDENREVWPVADAGLKEMVRRLSGEVNVAPNPVRR